MGLSVGAMDLGAEVADIGATVEASQSPDSPLLVAGAVPIADLVESSGGGLPSASSHVEPASHP